MKDSEPFGLLQCVLEQEIDILQQRLKECLESGGEHLKLEIGLLRLSLKKRKSRLESVRTLLCSDNS